MSKKEEIKQNNLSFLKGIKNINDIRKSYKLCLEAYGCGEIDSKQLSDIVKSLESYAKIIDRPAVRELEAKCQELLKKCLELEELLNGKNI